MLRSKYPNTVQNYDDLEDVRKEHPDHIVNGVKIKQPHFLQFDGCTRGHHSIIEFTGERYGYDNVLVGTNGAAKTVYLLKDGRVVRSFRKRNLRLLESDDFIVLDSSLYHIPTAKSTPINERRFELVERVPNVLDFKNKDKQIEWTGNGFETYDNIDSEEVSEESLDISKDELETKDLRELSNTTEYKYRKLLKDIVEDIHWVNNIDEAEMYVNGNFDISDEKKVKRKYRRIKSMYAKGELDIKEFEQKLEEFLIDNEEYIWVTGQYSDTQISEFSEDEEEEEEMNSAFNW